MAVNEFHREYVNFIGTRIEGELSSNREQSRGKLAQALVIVKRISILKELGSITSEEAESLTHRILELYPQCPQLEEELKKESVRL